MTSSSVAETTTYSADYSAPVRSFRFKPPTGALSDTNVTFNLTEDGRLKSVNGDSTGQAEAAAKAVITAAAAIAPRLGGAAPPPAGRLPECATIASWGGGKPVTVTYAQKVSFTGPVQAPVPLSPDPASAALYAKLRARLPVLSLSVGTPVPIAEPALLRPDATSGPTLLLNRTASVHLALAAGPDTVWSADVIVPLAEAYELPLPKAAPFGKVNFALTLAESGAVTALTYGQVSGAAGPANVAAAAAAAAAKPRTAADRAAGLKAEGDEIVENARLARCRANPSDCT